MTHPLSCLSTAELERLQGALQQQALDLANARLGLQRHGLPHNLGLCRFLAHWAEQEGSARSLALAIDAMLSERRKLERRISDLVWSGPSAGGARTTRDQAVVIRELIEAAQQRLLITTYNIWAAGFVRELLERIAEKLQANPDLDVRFVLNVGRGTNTSSDRAIVRDFIHTRWNRAWPSAESIPPTYYDPRALDSDRNRQAIFHVKTVVADQALLVTSANLSNNAQKRNCELGVLYRESDMADEVWEHFEGLIGQGVLRSLIPS